jgi:predicted AlkP superfamily pyrophosphatase or phosphodiesterase
MAYIKQPDAVGHKFGPDSAEILTAVAETDRISNISSTTPRTFSARNTVRGGQLYIVLTSDHGMAAGHTLSEPRKALRHGAAAARPCSATTTERSCDALS